MVFDFNVQASMGKVCFFALILSSLPQIKVYLDKKNKNSFNTLFSFCSLHGLATQLNIREKIIMAEIKKAAYKLPL
jgi:hypothetical protein